jgi:hypothetical protein
VIEWLEQQERVCRDVLSRWKSGGEIIKVPDLDIRWTYERAVRFAQELSTLIQAYNHLLWHSPISYCPQCGGQCCKAFDPHVGQVDVLMTLLLGLPLPTLDRVIDDETDSPRGECVYRTSSGCAWPEQWRPAYCWSYFCPGKNRSKPIGWEGLVLDLDTTIEAHLPAELQLWNETQGGLTLFVSYYLDQIVDPLDFAEVLEDALCEIFLFPLQERFARLKDDEALLYDLQDLADDLGHPPALAELAAARREGRSIASADVYRERFGSWRKALKAARLDVS